MTRPRGMNDAGEAKSVRETKNVRGTKKTLLDLSHEGQPPSRLVLGLTGNPGAGKTTAAEEMARLGAAVVNADAIGHRLLEKGSPVFEEIVDVFGETVLDESGGINRKALGALVFNDASHRARLNAIVHPLLLRDIKTTIEDFRNSSQHGPLVIDAALLYEWGIETWLDGVIVIVAPIEIRHQRIMERTNKTKDEAMDMENAQLPESIKTQRADIVADNSGRPDALYHTIQKIMHCQQS